MARLVLGIDGGGTKTQAAICDETGRVLGMGQAGGSGIDSVGAERALAAIREAVEKARRQAGLADVPFDGVFFGMAGVVSEADRAIVRTIARRLQLGERVGVDHDIRIALAGGLFGRPGIALIAGTGSSCFGINERGERWQAGGWGHLISDEGSSYWLGWNAIRLAMGAYDGRWQTALLEPVRRQLKLREMTDIHHRLYTQGISKAEIAAFAPLVIAVAQAGDEMAQALIRQGAHELALMVTAVAKHLGWRHAPCEVTLSGGLWQAGEVMLAPFREGLNRVLPAASIVMPELPPVLGACVLALQELGVEVEELVRSRLLEAHFMERD